MTSIGFSASGTAALRALQSTSKQMEQAQTRISTGYKINSASDDPIGWATATALRTSITTNKSVATQLKAATDQAKVSASALGEVNKSLRELKTKVNAYNGATSGEKVIIAAEIGELQNQIKDSINSASLGSTNWLTGKNADFTVATGTTGTITIAVQDNFYSSDGGTTADGILDTAISGKAYSILSMTGASAALNSGADAADIVSAIDAALTKVETATTRMTNAQSRLNARNDFLTSITDMYSSRLSDLVDTDMDEESAKLAALQVQQQLATTALSIINQSKTNILRLFQ